MRCRLTEKMGNALSCEEILCREPSIPLMKALEALDVPSVRALLKRHQRHSEECLPVALNPNGYLAYPVEIKTLTLFHS